jgi:hypothetical protein
MHTGTVVLSKSCLESCLDLRMTTDSRFREAILKIRFTDRRFSIRPRRPREERPTRRWAILHLALSSEAFSLL